LSRKNEMPNDEPFLSGPFGIQLKNGLLTVHFQKGVDAKFPERKRLFVTHLFG
jgi:hypothetical protein